MKWQIWRKNLGGFLDPEKTCFLVDVMIATEVSIFGYVISQKVKVEVKKIKDFFLKPTILFHCSRYKHLPWKLVLKHWQTNWAISSSHLNLATWTLFVLLGQSQPTGKGSSGYILVCSQRLIAPAALSSDAKLLTSMAKAELNQIGWATLFKDFCKHFSISATTFQYFCNIFIAFLQHVPSTRCKKR